MSVESSKLESIVVPKTPVQELRQDFDSLKKDGRNQGFVFRPYPRAKRFRKFRIPQYGFAMLLLPEALVQELRREYGSFQP